MRHEIRIGDANEARRHNRFESRVSRKTVFLFLGILLFGVLIALPPPSGMPAAGWRVAAVVALMAAWWVGEAIPVPVTALVPVILFPLLGVSTLKAAAAPYANPLIFLFLGGFVIALAFERWHLHRRVAVAVLIRVGTRPAPLIGGFMAATAALSMWVSNTATTVMMLPIGLSVIGLLHRGGDNPGAEDRNFAIAILLGIAYAASIGGLGTLVGTPPNAFLAAYFGEKLGITVGFGQWLLIGLPAVAVLLPIAWVMLTKLVYPVGDAPIEDADAILRRERAEIGPITGEEVRVALVFAATGLAWVFRPAINGAFPGLGLTDPAIALIGAVALFVIPARLEQGTFLMNWDWAKRLPWGTLLLFGGGLSLASAMGDSGLAAWISEAFSAHQTLPLPVLLLIFVATVIFLTEITSNTATAAVFLPVVVAFAAGLGVDPLSFAVPVALAASCAFMMPVATPPNAIVFGSGHVTIPDMVRAGFWLNLIAIAVIAGGGALAVGVFGD